MDELRDEDIVMDVMRQNDGRACAVRLTHRPSGTVAFADDGDTIAANRDRAMELLKAELGLRIGADLATAGTRCATADKAPH